MSARLATAAALVAILAAASAAQFPLITSFEGDALRQLFGASVASVGDVDGDGFGDVAVGSPYANNGAGNVKVFSGETGALLLLLNGAPGANLGSAVERMDDLDGDGVAELAVGASNDGRQTGFTEGSVSIYSGAGGARIYQVFGASYAAFLGLGIARAGDLDGDGSSDMIVEQAGGAVVLSGATGALIRAHPSSGAAIELGRSATGLGDLDGDGVADYALGAPGATLAGFPPGQVHIYSGATGNVIRIIYEGAPSERFGEVIASAGDLDNDGLAEVIVGAPLATQPGSGATTGRVDVYRGLDGTLLQRHYGNPGENFGHAVAGPGDMDQDGVADIAIAALQPPTSPATPGGPGYVTVISGFDGSALASVSGSQGNAGFSLDEAGDVNGDGFRDLIVGDPVLGSGPEKGSAHIVSVAGAREYTAVPTKTPFVTWAPGSAGQGSVSITFVVPNSLLLISLAQDLIPVLPFLTVQVDISPTALLSATHISADVTVPVDLTTPYLTGTSLFLQAFNPTPLPFSSKGLELRFLP